MPKTSTMRANHQNAGIPATSFIKAKAEVRSFDEALAFLAGERVKELASHVYVLVAEGEPEHPSVIAIRLYNTDIIRYYKPTALVEEFSADNGGFRTPTTVTRMNQFGPRGYHFCHDQKVLKANGVQACHSTRLPVWIKNTLVDLVVKMGLEVKDFAQADFIPPVSKAKEKLDVETIIDDLLQIGLESRCIALRIKSIPIPAGKKPYVLVNRLGKVIGERTVFHMNDEEVAKRNEDEKVFGCQWVPEVR